MTDNEYTEYAAVGFAYDSFDDLMDDLMDAAGENIQDVANYDGVVSYQDPSGARLTAFQDFEGWHTTPAFRTPLTVDAAVYRVQEFLTCAELYSPSGTLLGPVIAASDDYFTFPASFPGGSDKGRGADRHLSAWVRSYEACSSAEELIVAAGDTDVPPSLDPESVRSGILYSPSAERFYRDYNPRRVAPYARLVGEVTGAEQRTNTLTSQNFTVAQVNHPAGTLPVLFAGSVDLTPGTFLDATVFISLSTDYWS